MEMVEEEEEEGGGGSANSFVWRVSLTGFDDDKGCCRGKQHQSIKIVRGLGTPEDQVAFTDIFFFASLSPTSFLLTPSASLSLSLCLALHNPNTHTNTHPSTQATCYSLCRCPAGLVMNSKDRRNHGNGLTHVWARHLVQKNTYVCIHT